MDRQKALEILRKYLVSDYLIKHSYAVESVMKELAKKFEPEKEALWAMTGLLHDLDSDLVDYRLHPELHCKRTLELLKEKGF